jgi:hypothetical protein
MGTQDGGTTWSDLTEDIEDLPDNTYVSRIVASNAEEGRVYATFDGHYSGDFAPYVYVSDDYGENWRAITSGLPQTSVNVLIEHPDVGNLLFLGNEVGVFVSLDAGDSWEPLMNGLPTVPVDDVRIHPAYDDLVIGTHGRGVWVLDDITPLEQLAGGSILAGAPYLFRGGQTIHWRIQNVQEWTGSAEFRLPNPRVGARIRYWIPEGFDLDGSNSADDDGGDDDDENDSDDRDPNVDDDGDPSNEDPRLEIKILTATGQEVRTLDGPAIPGAHEVFWDLRIDPAYEPEPTPGGGRGGGAAGARGPTVLPSVYQIQVDVGRTSMRGDLTVRQDPRITVSRADLAARQTAMMSMYALQAPVYEARQAILRLRTQLSDVEELLGDADATASFQDDVDGIRQALEDVGRDLNRLPMGTGRQIEASTSRPTEDQLQGIERAWQDAPELFERLNVLISDRIPSLNRRLNAEEVRADPGQPLEVPRRRGR